MNPISATILGPPKTGKSSTAGSIAEVIPPEEVLLMCMKPGEEKTWIYEKYGLTERAEMYFDARWRPTLGQYQADAFQRLNERLYELLEDERYGAVILDPGTDIFSIASHYLLAPNQVASASDLADGRGFYGQVKSIMKECVQSASALSSGLVAKRPKHVIIPWHVQPMKEGEFDKVSRAKKKSADEKAEDVRFIGSVLPMLDGQYKYDVHADFDLLLYTDVLTRKPNNKEYKEGIRDDVTEYQIQVVPGGDRHAGVRIAPMLSRSKMPNSLKVLFEEIERG